jgi:ketosteroid isomerase-like protein
MANPAGDRQEVQAANETFYREMSAGSIDGISAVCAQDDNVTVLHENSKDVAVGWPAVLETWKAVPFDAFSELSVVMSNPVIQVNGSMAWVAGFEQVRGKSKDGQEFAWTALGTNIYEKRGGKWLMVHHHASKAADELVT